MEKNPKVVQCDKRGQIFLGSELDSSVIIDSKSNPHIIFFDQSNTDLRHKYYNGSIWKEEVIADNVGIYNSVALDSNDKMYISYYDQTHTNEDLIVTYDSFNSTGRLNISTENDFVGRINVSCLVLDQEGASSVDSFFVNIVEDIENQVPVIDFSGLSNFDVLKNDYDDSLNLSDYIEDIDNSNEEIKWSCSSDNENVSVLANNETKKLEITTLNDYLGSAVITCIAFDLENESEDDSFTVNIVEEMIIVDVNSTFVNSNVNGIVYNGYFEINGLIKSIINESTISGIVLLIDSYIYNSVIEDSQVDNCDIYDSSLTDTFCKDAIIDPSEIIDSNITGSIVIDSFVMDSNITHSSINDTGIINVDINNSNVTGSFLYKTKISNAEIVDDIMNYGIIVLPNGTVEIKNTPTNLSDIMNYPPYVDFTLSSDNLVVTITDLTIDENVGSVLNDNLSYYWDYGDGTNSTTSITEHDHTYLAEGDYIISLTVNDEYGETEIYSDLITVSVGTTTVTPSGGGGSGRSPSRDRTQRGICSPTWICTPWSSCVNGIKTRTCTDKWNCGIDSGKPNLTQSCTVAPPVQPQLPPPTQITQPLPVEQSPVQREEIDIQEREEGGSSLTFFIIAMIIIVILGGAGFVFYEIEKAGKALELERQQQTIDPVTISRLQSYAKQMLEQGYTKEQIKQELLREGWSRKVIRRIV